jgi:hypothetical protein
MSYGQYSPYSRGRSNPLHNQPKSGGQKRQVFPTGEIAHLWAHQTQANARNPQGNLYFKGPVIYSYRDSFPMARIVENSKGKRAVLYSTATYSVTTSQHQNQVRRSIPSAGKDAMPVFEVPSLGTDRYASYETLGPVAESVHTANLEYFVRQSRSELETSARARSNAQWLLNSALEYQTTARLYAKFFGCKMPRFSFLPTGPKLEKLRAEYTERKRKSHEATSKAYATRRANRDRMWAERNAKWKAEREEQERFDALTLPERIAKWRNGEYAYGRLGDTVLLRIKGEEVETSLGARVPIDHARRALRLVRAVRRTGKAYQRNGHTFHVGHYAFYSITPDGTLTAGCHVIPWAEIARIADSLDGRVDQTELILSDLATVATGETTETTGETTATVDSPTVQ